MNISYKTISNFLISTSQDDADPSKVCAILDDWLLDWKQNATKTDVNLIIDHLEELIFKMKTIT